MICGSVPPECARVLFQTGPHGPQARSQKLLDTDGEALIEGVESAHRGGAQSAGSERLLNTALITRSHFLDAAARIRRWAPVGDPVARSRGAIGVRSAAHRVVRRAWTGLPIGAAMPGCAFVWAMTITPISRCPPLGVAPAAPRPPAGVTSPRSPRPRNLPARRGAGSQVRCWSSNCRASRRTGNRDRLQGRLSFSTAGGVCPSRPPRQFILINATSR